MSSIIKINQDKNTILFTGLHSAFNVAKSSGLKAPVEKRHSGVNIFQYYSVCVHVDGEKKQ